jgi:hypothetical protein
MALARADAAPARKKDDQLLREHLEQRRRRPTLPGVTPPRTIPQ